MACSVRWLALWLFIVSAGGAVGLDLYTCAKCLDLILAAAAIAAFFFLARRWLSGEFAALCATVTFASGAWFMRWAGSGMETSLTALLLILTFLRLARRDHFGATAFSAMLFLVRPEACLLFPVLCFDALRTSGNRKSALPNIFGMIAVYAVIVLPWLAYAKMIFGNIIPNTLRAKSSGQFSVGDVWITFLDYAKTLGLSDGIAVIVILICGAWIVAKRIRASENSEGTWRDAIAAMLWIVLLSAVYCLKGVNIVSRYLLLFSPLLVLLAFQCAQAVLRISGREHLVRSGLLALSLLIVSQNQIGYRIVVLPGIKQFTKGMDETFIPIGKWLNANTTANSTVIVGDIGAIGYYSERTVFDVAGLISPQMLPLLQKGYLPYDIIESKLYSPYCSPDYIIDRNIVPEALKPDTSLIPVFTREFNGISLTQVQPAYYTVYKVIR